MKKTILTAIMAFGTIIANAQSIPVYQDESKPLEERVKDALSRMTLEEKCRLSYAQSKFTSPGVARLGIPELYMSDGPHGVRMEINWNDWGHSNWTNDACTAFPALTCLAATWNTDMAALYGKSVGEEARYRKKDILLGPGVNIYRTPLNGRNFEYMGEDPYLAGRMAVPYIKGLQSNGVSCCLKHYALNDQEEYRGHVDVKVSDRALYEIYLPAFKTACIEGNAWSIMGSYNQYKDMFATHNRYLINDILKGEWGYKGAVITDWGACHDTKQAALYGCDIEMGSYTNGLTSEANGFGYDDYYLGTRYLEMAKKGEVSMDVVNDKAARVLRLIFQSAMNSKKPFGSIRSKEHLDAGEKIAEEGIVLLKNGKCKKENGELLPINDGKYANILIVGDNATKDLCAGGGSSELKAYDYISPLDAIRKEFPKSKIEYAQGYESGLSRYDGADFIAPEVQEKLKAEALEKAKKADLIIYIGGLNKNHFEDCEGGDRRSYHMSYGQDTLIEELVKIQPRTIVVITSGNAVAMPWLNKVPALIQNWYTGSHGALALANVLSGDVNPSGKTVFTYAKELTDYPAHQYGLPSYPGVMPEDMPKSLAADAGADADKNPSSAYLLANADKIKKSIPAALTTDNLNTDFDALKHNGRGNEAQVYAEDILVGYRYFDTKKKPVLFPFGYGLSYTTFKYGKATASATTITDNGTITFTVPVTNTGKVAGKEIVQLYIGDDKASVVRPTKELKAFAKVSLAPGETKTVSLTIKTDDLKFFDETSHAWKVEPGTFKAYIGASSADIKSTVAFSYK